MILSPAKAGLTIPGYCIPRAYARGYSLSPLRGWWSEQQAGCLRFQHATAPDADIVVKHTKGFPD
jgi:hypothetical protein